ncbi:type III PLP-dependent enzyme (plasmid) [Rhodopseudomonas palustris]
MRHNLGPSISEDLLRNYVASRQNSRLCQPVYIYDTDVVQQRVALLKDIFSPEFGISYAIKSNPNQALLNQIVGLVDTLDASSYSEVMRARATGIPDCLISYSGPGKRFTELEAFIGNFHELVVESFEEIADAATIAATKEKRQAVLIRINPDHVPRGFGASMSGKPSQFGIDEQAAAEAIAQVDAASHLDLHGFHIYTGSNSLSASTLIENFENMAQLFLRFSQDGRRPIRKLIFGAGFGLPYHVGQEPLDLIAVRDGAMRVAAGLRAHPGLASTEFILELGRWITGPSGALLTTVLVTKHSRGQKIAVCDAGFNNHLAACGLMGSVFRKDWPIKHLTAAVDSVQENIKLTGPLCTSIDALAGPLDFPVVQRGDILAVMLSGAYGLTASPTRFISHPDPIEILHKDGQFEDVSESHHNHTLVRAYE